MMATNDTYTLEVGDASAEFHMPTVAEFRDLNQLKEQPVIEDREQQALLWVVPPGAMAG
jgi:hypothetical protein